MKENVARRAAGILRLEGPRALWFRILGETVYRRMILFERRLDDPIVAASPAVPVEISQLQPGEVDEYTAFRPGTAAAEIRSRLERGHQCFVARRQGVLANAIWAAAGTAYIRYLDCEIRIAPDEAYMYDSYTAPSFRRLNINAARAEVMERHFRERAFFRFWALAMPENLAGIGATVGAGYHHAGIIGRIKIGPWRHDYRQLVPGVRPVVLIPRRRARA
jgi:hypothetical protein